MATAPARPHALPSFDVLVRNYPNLLNPDSVKRLIGGHVDDTKSATPWINNTCTIRLSRDLNYSNVPIPQHSPGLATITGADKFNYAYRVAEMQRWMRSWFGAPDLEVAKPVSRAAFASHKGIIAFDIHWSDASGHFDLWDGATFHDEIYGISHAGHDFFDLASRVSLWFATGTATLGKPSDA